MEIRLGDDASVQSKRESVLGALGQRQAERVATAAERRSKMATVKLAEGGSERSVASSSEGFWAEFTAGDKGACTSAAHEGAGCRCALQLACFTAAVPDRPRSS
jgi:hypothetical protein